MEDKIDLFQIQNKNLIKLDKSDSPFTKERELQNLFEGNLKTLLGVHFLKSEHTITDSQGQRQRIDTLGIDENNTPVIIEYKLKANVNIVSQGISYLSWLMEHKADFQILVRKKIKEGKLKDESVVDNIEWNAPRLICVATDFSKHDQNTATAKFIKGCSIELVRYRKFDDLLIIELLTKVSKKSSSPSISVPTTNATKKRRQITVSESLEKASPELKELYKKTEDFITSLGKDISKEVLQYYFAFRRMKNFVCVEIKPRGNKILLYLKINPDSLQLEDEFTRDVRKKGTFGTGDLEVTLKSGDDLERAKKLIQKSYEES